MISRFYNLLLLFFSGILGFLGFYPITNSEKSEILVLVGLICLIPSLIMMVNVYSDVPAFYIVLLFMVSRIASICIVVNGETDYVSVLINVGHLMFIQLGCLLMYMIILIIREDFAC